MENNQIINGFAENIEHHSQLIHDFFNENKEVFLKDEQLRDEFSNVNKKIEKPSKNSLNRLRMCLSEGLS